jgi:hypothetical protein
MASLTPYQVIERLKDKALESQQDSSTLYEVLNNLSTASGKDARVLTIMAQCRHEDAMLFTEAARLIKPGEDGSKS